MDVVVGRDVEVAEVGLDGREGVGELELASLVPDGGHEEGVA